MLAVLRKLTVFPLLSNFKGFLLLNPLRIFEWIAIFFEQKSAYAWFIKETIRYGLLLHCISLHRDQVSRIKILVLCCICLASLESFVRQRRWYKFWFSAWWHLIK
jgi:hypothetical protein